MSYPAGPIPSQTVTSITEYFLKITLAWRRGEVLSSMRHLWSSKDNLQMSFLPFCCMGSWNWIKLSNLVASPGSCWAISVAHRVLYVFLVVTYSCHTVHFLFGGLCNTVLITMLMSLCKSSKLHPGAKWGGVHFMPELWGQIQVVLWFWASA